ncbi:hypothetical protein CASFOL_021348 [Castilleja foliolosa]|uniref:Protein kinase domain-containing protein n=1 Tax=Castilleja foliolosa TaxID=1961234 RepID=A0ABD3CYY3_9LAMI
MGPRLSCYGSSEKDEESDDSKNGDNVDSKKEAVLPKEPTPKIDSKAFTFHELAVATNNFESLIGEGGFGRVYKGRLDSTGQVVAVKRLNQNSVQGNAEFAVEVLMLSLLHDENLVNLVGYCADGVQRLLVYEFMPLGSLKDHLHDRAPGREPLDWNTRMKIAVGAAKGLEYLHDKADPPAIHRDFKSSNILLDEGLIPKLSDFGIAKLWPLGNPTHISTRVMGTFGYLAPEYAMTGQVTLKCDVYSFGVVLLELVTGRKAINNTADGVQNLVAWARPLFKNRKKSTLMADPSLQGHYPKRGLDQVLAVAASCVQEQAATRPLIKDVVTALSNLASKPYDPNSQSNRSSSSTPRRKSGPDDAGAHQGSPSVFKKSPRIEKGGGSGTKGSLDGSERADSQNSSPASVGQARKTPPRARDSERDRAVALAKVWGENARDKKGDGSS